MADEQLALANPDGCDEKDVDYYDLANAELAHGKSVYGAQGYTMPNQNIRGKIYLQKDNSGVNVSYGKKISKDHTLNAKAAVFEKDAAFEIELKKKVKKTDIAIGTGGYTNYPSHIIYTYARIGF